MFFAAGAPTLTDTGAGGGDVNSGGSGDGSSGQPGPGAGDAGPADTGDPGDVQGQSGSGVDDTRQPDGIDPNALVDAGDGRKIPQKYAELFKTDKDLREMYFATGALRKGFPGGVREALQLKKDLEEVGGLEAVEQLKGDLGSFTADAELFEKGDPKWIESGFSENPESALKHFTHALGYVGEHHPEQYNHLMAKVIMSDLDGEGGLPVRELHGLLSGLKDNPEAQKLAASLARYYNGREKLARQVPEKKIDPQQAKLDEQKQQLDTEKQQIRNQKINSESIPYLMKTVDTTVDKIAKDSGFDLAKVRTEQPKRYAKFVKDVKSAIHESVLSDEKWLDRYSSALASGDTAKCVRMLNARHDQAINGNGREPGVVNGLFEEWFGPMKKVAPKTDAGRPAARPGSGQGSAPLRVSTMPPKNEINWQSDKTKIIDQVAMLKTGKIVTWAS